VFCFRLCGRAGVAIGDPACADARSPKRVGNTVKKSNICRLITKRERDRGLHFGQLYPIEDARKGSLATVAKQPSSRGRAVSLAKIEWRALTTRFWCLARVALRMAVDYVRPRGGFLIRGELSRFAPFRRS